MLSEERGVAGAAAWAVIALAAWGVAGAAATEEV
jgi:hypothetical protein